MARLWIKGMVLAVLAFVSEAPAQPPATPPQPPSTIVLRTATLLDGRGAVLKSSDIVVVNGKIQSVGGKAPAGATVYDLRGFTVLPGMIDTHEHIFYHFRNGRFAGMQAKDETPEEAMLAAAENGGVILNAGFTTIQSPGPGRTSDLILKDAYARGILPGPRLLTSLEWFRFDPPGSAPPPQRLREMVRERKAQGADFIKIFASASIRDAGTPLLDQEQMNALCGEARAQGLRTLVHAYNVAVRMAIEAGCTTIEHGTNGMTPEVVAMMVQKGVYYDPTIGLAGRNYVENREKFIGLGNYTAQGMDELEAKLKRNLPPTEFTEAIRDPRLKVVFGTDAVAGGHGRNGLELVYRVRQGGMDPMRAVESMTSMAAESLGLGDSIGSIAPGYDADIVALDGNPLTDIDAVMRPLFVMKQGVVVKFTPKP